MRTVVLVLAFLFAAAAPARAQYDVEREVPVIPPSSAPPAEPTPRLHWYGWQILLLDLGALAVAGMVLSEVDAEGPRLTLAYLPFIASTAAVHAYNGHPARAWASGAVRAVPLLLLMTWDHLDEEGRDGWLALALVGNFAYYFLDVSVVSLETQRPRAQADGGWTFSAAPVSGGGAVAGIGGTF